MTPHRLWTFIGVVGAFAGLVDVARQHKTRKEEQLPPLDEQLPLDLSDVRDRLVAWGESHEGDTDGDKYWQQINVKTNPAKWCNAFVVAGLRAVGLVPTNVVWKQGLVSTVPELTVTNDPKRGDLAYFAKNQHVAIIADIAAGNMRLINGNGVGHRVTITERPTLEATRFYSIEPLIKRGEVVNEPLTVEMEP